MKKALFLLLRLVVTVSLVAFVLTRVNFRDREITGKIESRQPGHLMIRTGKTKALHMILRENVKLPSETPYDRLRPGDDVTGVEQGFCTILGTLNMSYYLSGFAIIGALLAVATARWRVLLKVQGVRLSYREALKLTLVGLFFNNVSVGLTGGDVVKAYLVTRTTDRKAQAVLTVFLDRVVGLVAMLLVAGAGALALVGEAEVRRVALYLYGCIGIVIVGTGLYYSRRLRRALRVDAMLSRLPFERIIRRVDEALLAYRSHKRAVAWAFLLSFICHGMAVVACIIFGRALGIEGAAAHHYFMFIPTIIFISALPVTVAGWGLRETSFQYFFGMVGVAATLAVSLSVVYALTYVVWSLVGGVVFAFFKIRPPVKEMEHVVEESATY